MDLILLVILLVIGITGLVKKKIKISSKKEITGRAVIGLSIFYIIMGGVILFVSQGVDLVMVGVIALITIVVVIFAKKQPVLPKNPQAQV
ncbi:MAG: hypothetical protein A2V69_02695 [Candidatus Portnoybacteria bacterium RBG_13_40_8]|uniref:Uncharacterized protein n=1 Tax=Candidatus Portnoybacteria bacterium RBG_13_40_8 TaxID=1801990 RepID=A0A1G2F402_9BACT|nr:MAG: hypothetical protein A2V69_02695 [Candidatus Portnoybacteria bacterium RBG_13_40_8]OGZ35471.1 MAG: hypothetical protein A2V60_03480 [Candidatus Portnoybacteria bacterium RIFCSPHIGHO2_01_FULL_39_19]